MVALGTSGLFVLAAWLVTPGDVATSGGVIADAVEFRGRVVCVGPSQTVQTCGEAPSRFALRSAEGVIRPFLTTDVMTGMFADEYVRECELLVRARPSPGGIEIIKVYSIHADRLHDLDYFCEVCNIVAYAPGPCPCCRQALVLRERPIP